MSWIPKADLLRDYPEMPAKPGKGVGPVDGPACSPYLNRPLRRFAEVAASRHSAGQDDRGTDGTSSRPDQWADPKPQ